MFEPLLSAAPQIQLHFVAALLALLIGPFALFRKHRDRLHKTLGYFWIASMFVTSISAFFITEIRMIGAYSPIHLLAALSLISLGMGLRFAIVRNISAHRKTMQNLYFWALGIAGLFTFAPGRVLNRVFFQGMETAGFIVLLVCVGGVVAYLRYFRQKSA